MRTGKFDDVEKNNGYTFILKRMHCTWGNGITYQTRVYEGNKLVYRNENLDNYREAFECFCYFVENYGTDNF